MINVAKMWIGQIVELGVLLIALGIVIQVLFGPSSISFFGPVTSNLVGLIDSLGDNGLVGLIAIAIILWLFGKKTPAAS